MDAEQELLKFTTLKLYVKDISIIKPTNVVHARLNHLSIQISGEWHLKQLLSQLLDNYTENDLIKLIKEAGR